MAISQIMSGVWESATPIIFTSGTAVTISGVEDIANLVIIANNVSGVGGSGVMTLNYGEYNIGPRAYTSAEFTGMYVISDIDPVRVQKNDGTITLTSTGSGTMYVIETHR